MSSVIVSIVDERKTVEVDVELPIMEKIGPLRKGIIDMMDIPYLNMNTRLYHPRLKKVLNDEETLAHVGVWSGDYLVLINRG